MYVDILYSLLPASPVFHLRVLGGSVGAQFQVPSCSAAYAEVVQPTFLHRRAAHLMHMRGSESVVITETVAPEGPHVEPPVYVLLTSGRGDIIQSNLEHKCPL
jgi:hypothetical protein